jgi:hypothetical protein
VLYVARPGSLHASAQWLVDLSDAWGRSLERGAAATTDGRRRRGPI